MHPEFKISATDSYSHDISSATENADDDWTQMIDDLPIVGSAHGRSDDESSGDSDSDDSDDSDNGNGQPEVEFHFRAPTPMRINNRYS